MNIKWTAGLSEEQANTIKDLVKRNTILIGRFREIVSNKMQSSERKQISEKEYDNPSWAYKQADSNGYQRALKEILELIG